jgi:hypothetical protein
MGAPRRPLVTFARALATAWVVLAGCNTPSGGGPGLEPPGNDSSGFANGAGQMTMAPTDAVGGSGAAMEAPGPGMDPDTMPGPTPAPVMPGGADGGAVVGPDAGGDASVPATDAGHGATSCDPRQVTCKDAAPTCPDSQVPEVVDACFGACVPIDACACDGPDACPDSNHYTCHMFKMRCGPYL